MQILLVVIVASVIVVITITLFPVVFSFCWAPISTSTWPRYCLQRPPWSGGRRVEGFILIDFEFFVRTDFNLFGSISICSDRFPFVRIDFNWF